MQIFNSAADIATRSGAKRKTAPKSKIKVNSVKAHEKIRLKKVMEAMQLEEERKLEEAKKLKEAIELEEAMWLLEFNKLDRIRQLENARLLEEAKLSKRIHRRELEEVKWSEEAKILGDNTLVEELIDDIVKCRRSRLQYHHDVEIDHVKLLSVVELYANAVGSAVNYVIGNVEFAENNFEETETSKAVNQFTTMFRYLINNYMSDDHNFVMKIRSSLRNTFIQACKLKLRMYRESRNMRHTFDMNI
jgi:hypothetical protein